MEDPGPGSPPRAAAAPPQPPEAAIQRLASGYGEGRRGGLEAEIERLVDSVVAQARLGARPRAPERAWAPHPAAAHRGAGVGALADAVRRERLRRPPVPTAPGR